MKAAFLTTLVANAIAALLGGWALMFAIGIVHHEWIPACPTIGYGWAVGLAALLRAALFNPSTGGESS